MRDKFVYLLLCGITSFASATSILEKYTRGPGNVYHGRFTRDVHEPELLVPRHVNEDGKFGTYELPKFYDRRDITERRKRSSDNEIDKLHLILPFNGADHHVELSPYHEFISPEMVIETRGPGIGKSPTEGLRFDRAPDQQCHYRGNVRGHTNSRAALSLCNGVAGYVQTNEGRYFIEPLNEAEPASDGQHVHMAYRRKAPHEKEETGSASGSGPKQSCGTNDNWEAAWAEQLAKRQQRLIESAEGRSSDNDSSLLPSKRADTKSLSATHSIHRFIEIGIVCDRRFLDYHNGTDYEKYLMTVMNMVSDLYHDSSCGNQIDVVVVRIIYLEVEKDEIDLVITPRAEKTLESFAAWAEKMNPKDHKHPNHYDVAVLVSRHDLCAEDTGCDLTGLAYVAAACDPSKAASINEDSGLLLGIIITHEVGHVMGCSHDEIHLSGCPPQDKDESYFVMSPIVDIFSIRWSTCSRKFITAFLESGLGECLNDDPRNPPDKYRYPNMLPGAMYDANFQCGFDKPGVTFCDRKKDVCERLWCKSGTSCYTKSASAADGTKCGEKKWCIHKKCVDMGSRPAAVHGGWGEWGASSDCSRTCGGGIKSTERECNKPTPANGGRYCLGERKKFSTCNVTPCGASTPSYRVTQCAEYNNKTPLNDGKKHKWVPLLREDLNPCELYCLSDSNVFMKLAPVTKDATPCKGGTNNMCISGLCRKVGCDWVIDSEAIDDKCGVCKGDGTQCSPVEGEFTRKDLRDYQKVVTIPKGARSILVTENKESENTLAVKTEKNDKYCLNGEHREMRNGDYECAGAILIYSHPEPQREEISIRGPLTEPIQIQYMFFKPKLNYGVKWKYYVKSAGNTPVHKAKYLWDFTEWGECTAKCGGGTMVSNPSCIEESSGVVSPTFCQNITRPDPKSRTCGEKSCLAKWRVSQWSKCNSCDGKPGMKRRKVQCIKRAARPGGEDVQANLTSCRGRVPKQRETCVGTRPCRKKCPKRSRDCVTSEIAPEPKDRERSLDEQRRMIDEFVDLGLARYLQRTRGRTFDDISKKSLKRDVSEDFRSLLRDWAMIGKKENEEMAKRTCDKDQITKLSAANGGKLRKQQAAIKSSQEVERQTTAGKRFVTPKPGTIIKDFIPASHIVLYEVPFKDDDLKANMSDIGFQEGGDIIDSGIDTKEEKVYHGVDAVNALAAMDSRNTEKIKEAAITLPTTVSEHEVSTYESASPRDNKANP